MTVNSINKSQSQHQIQQIARTMNTAYFRHHQNTENIEFTFEFKSDVHGIDRIFNFQRTFTETIETTFGRVRINFEKELRKQLVGGNKKKKGKNEEAKSGPNPVIEVNIQLLKDGKTIERNVTWANLFTAIDGHVNTNGLVLRIFGQDFVVTYNYPYIGQIALPTIIMAGYQCYPANCEVSFAKREECRFEWFRGKPVDGAAIVWKKCGDSFFYDVTEADVRHKIRVSSVSSSTHYEFNLK